MLNVTTRLITTTDQLADIVDDLLNATYLTTDTETSGLQRYAEVVGISFATSSDTSYYIPIKIYKPDTGLVRPWSDEAYLYVQNVIIEALTASKRLITHNGVFDAKVIKNTFNVDIMPFIFADTQLLHHTAINESPPHGLKKLAVKYLDPDADSPQEDLKQSVLANGGRWTKEQKDMYMGDWKLLGTYACFDTIYTRRLFDKFYPELLKSPKLIELWDKEVMPLMAVSYDLNTTGIEVDLEYFQKLKLEMLAKIKSIEDEIYIQLKDRLTEYELNKMKLSTNITERSEFGKFLKVNELWPWKENSDIHNKALKHWYTKKYGEERVFNLDSGDDKAFLLYDVLELPVKEMTKSGKRSTSKTVLDELAKEYEDSSAILKLMRDRSKELKLLSTYVDPILESNEDGKIYPSFNQTGTTSGRYSCGGSSMNLQTLPRNDERIKAGFIPEEGMAFVAADYSSLEPRSFAFVTGEPKIKSIFQNKLDFYSAIAINVLGLKNVSANPEDDNYLGTIDKEKRQWVKAIALSIPYGAQAGRLSQIMKIDYEEAQDVYDKYIQAFPVLKKWMDKADLHMKMHGYTESLLGRRKRNDVIKTLYNKYGVRDFSKKQIQAFLNKHPGFYEFEDGISLYLEVRNAVNVAKNHMIQSLSASIINAAAINIKNELDQRKIEAKITLNVHDELVLQCFKKDIEVVSEILQRNMEHNWITDMIDVPMIAEPVITDKNLAEAK